MINSATPFPCDTERIGGGPEFLGSHWINDVLITACDGAKMHAKGESVTASGLVEFLKQLGFRIMTGRRSMHEAELIVVLH